LILILVARIYKNNSSDLRKFQLTYKYIKKYHPTDLHLYNFYNPTKKQS
jgi:hypothetical protein